MRKVRRMVQHLLRYKYLSSVLRGLMVYFLYSTVTIESNESKEFILVKLKRNLHSSIWTERSALCAVDFLIQQNKQNCYFLFSYTRIFELIASFKVGNIHG